MIINVKYVMSYLVLFIYYLFFLCNQGLSAAVGYHRIFLHDEVGKTAYRYSHRRWRCLTWLAAGWSFTSTSKTSDRRCVVQVQGELEDTPSQNKRLKPQELSFFCAYF